MFRISVKFDYDTVPLNKTSHQFSYGQLGVVYAKWLKYKIEH